MNIITWKLVVSASSADASSTSRLDEAFAFEALEGMTKWQILETSRSELVYIDIPSKTKYHDHLPAQYTFKVPNPPPIN